MNKPTELKKSYSQVKNEEVIKAKKALMVEKKKM